MLLASALGHSSHHFWGFPIEVRLPPEHHFAIGSAPPTVAVSLPPRLIICKIHYKSDIRHSSQPPSSQSLKSHCIFIGCQGAHTSKQHFSDYFEKCIEIEIEKECVFGGVLLYLTALAFLKIEESGRVSRALRATWIDRSEPGHNNGC